MLGAVHEAALAITSELALPIVLNRIVELARDLAGARYAALGIPSLDGSHLVQFITSGLSKQQQQVIPHLPSGKGLLGILLQPGAQPLRVARISEDPRSAGFCEGHPVMTSFLGVPIQSRGKLLGILYLTDKEDGDEFSEEDQVLIEVLAAYAAVAIENARLYQQIKRLAVLEERERIGMDLHDGIIQSIYAVGLMLEHTSFVLEQDQQAAAKQLKEAINGLNTIIKDIRNYILDLRPARFQGTDLAGALRNLTQEFQANTLADVSLHYNSEINGNLNEQVATAAFHIVQEALANAAKHAAATHLSVSVELQDGELVLNVQDNGRGFSPGEKSHPLGHGLSNMELRARAVGGRVMITSAPGKGTQVTACLPLTFSEC